jgi:hypothetical protein
MHLTSALAALLPSFALAGNVVVHNFCPNIVYLYEVTTGNIGPEVPLNPTNSYTNQIHSVPTGGVALKLFTIDRGLQGQNAQTNVAYTLTNVDNTVWSVSPWNVTPIMCYKNK